MKLISHRGNLNETNDLNENTPQQIDKVILLGFYCEVDVWCFNDGKIFLGHDKPKHKVEIDFLKTRSERLYIHTKNIYSLKIMLGFDCFNCFSHFNDEFVLTSKGEIWCFPAKNPIKFGINLMPEWNHLKKEELNEVYGICSDYIGQYA